MPGNRDLERATDALLDEIEGGSRRRRGSDSTLEILARSHAALVGAATGGREPLRRARGNNAEEEDEIGREAGDDEDENDDDEDEDQPAGRPGADSGEDDTRGTVRRSRGRGMERARDDDDDGDDDDDEGMDRSRGRRTVGESSYVGGRGGRRGGLGRSRGSRRHRAENEGLDARDDEFGDEDRGFGGGGYRDDDADHEEDASFPGDGRDVGAGDDDEVFGIGAQRHRARRAIRRSVEDGRDGFFRSAAESEAIAGAVDASEAFEDLLDILADREADQVITREMLQRSAASLSRQGRIQDGTVRVLAALSQRVIDQGKQIEQLVRSFAALTDAPRRGAIPFGVPAPVIPFGTPGTGDGAREGRRGRGGKPEPLTRSRGDLIVAMEDGVREGWMSTEDMQRLGTLSAEQIVQNLSPTQRERMGVSAVS